LEYVAGSARAYGDGFDQQGTSISDFLTADGAPLGYDSFDGVVRPTPEGAVTILAALRVLPG
jgi:hypothetical protein